MQTKRKIAGLVTALVLVVPGLAACGFQGNNVDGKITCTDEGDKVISCSVQAAKKPHPDKPGKPKPTLTNPPAPTATATPTPTPTPGTVFTDVPPPPPTATQTATATPPPPPPAGWWKPTGDYSTGWQVVLSQANPPFISGVSIYVYDGFDASASHVSSIKAKAGMNVCYMSAGSWEDWRPDAGFFPAGVKGNSNGWPGEKWLDIRKLDVLKPLMEKRADVCKSKGFDAVDWDNVDGYSNRTGFSLNANDQLVYNKMLAEITHARGMAVSLKNDVEQLPELEPFFDMAINESCFEYNECDGYTVFTSKGKPVINIEYKTLHCAEAKAINMASMKKSLSLDQSRTPCQ